MTETRYRGRWDVVSLLVDRAERWPDRVAVSGTARELTYAELVDRAARVAGGLRSLGVRPGDRVATMLESDVDYLAAWHGIAWAGAVDVPVNTELKGAFLEHVLRDGGARVAILDGRWLDRLAAIDAGGVEHVVVVGDPASKTAATQHAFADLLGASRAPTPSLREDGLAHILYTSGTTGRSKGVMCSQRSWCWLTQGYIDALDLTAEDVGYSMFPLFHQMGRAAMAGSSLWVGAPLVLRPRFSASGFWDDVRATGATFFGYFGAVIHFLWRQPERPDDADNPARVAFGASAPPELAADWERRFGLDLVEVYGSTELGLACIASPGTRRRGTMGRPVAHLEIRIHDAEDEPVPAGQLGQIVARPRRPGAMFDGYWGDPEGTLRAFRNLWFHSGDVGSIDADGYLTFHDRDKDVIRRRGQQISSFEVEQAVRAQPEVMECAAIPVPSELGDEEVMVAVVLEPGVELDAADLWGRLVETMPRFAVPRYLRVVDELPKTPTQRVRKFELRAAGVTAQTHDRERLAASSTTMGPRR